MKIITNHLGYETKQPKLAIFQSDTPLTVEQFEIIDEQGNTVYQGHDLKDKALPPTSVDNWQHGVFSQLHFSDFNATGTYHIVVKSAQGNVTSEPFDIAPNLFQATTLSEIMHYFRAQRCQGIHQETDQAIPFYGETRSDKVDVRGGWYDASGDVSKYLSHLSYANFMNPQHTPMVVWNLLDGAQHLSPAHSMVDTLLDEALYGADFLIKMQDPAGYFYTTVFDNWSHDPTRRMICSYTTQEGIKNECWQAAFRQGGGVAIAALARASQLPRSGDCTQAQYLAAAERGFTHLLEHNLTYLNDGKENIIDDYCALLAATELFHATERSEYKEHAEMRANNLVSRLSTDDHFSGWFRADDATRPYFHAAEEGLPIVALLRLLHLEIVSPELKNRIHSALLNQAQFYVNISHEVSNPFQYPRQYQQSNTNEPRSAFFYPHHNESGYWWQGENARIASLSCAFRRLTHYFKRHHHALPELEALSQSGLDWILGLNPMNMCMMQGVGRHNPSDYAPNHKSIRGGICNGITSGFQDESSIDFSPTTDPMHSWRWGEQWLPHAAWFLLAICSD